MLFLFCGVGPTVNSPGTAGVGVWLPKRQNRDTPPQATCVATVELAGQKNLQHVHHMNHAQPHAVHRHTHSHRKGRAEGEAKAQRDACGLEE